MTFEELKNGMKNLFSSLGAKTSDSNYAVGLFDKTSAEPKGIMDMASLASVLGGIQGFTWRPGPYTGMINNMGYGFYYYPPSNEDSSLPPRGSSHSDWLWVFSFGRGDGLQIAWWNQDNRFSYRAGSFNDHAWTSWLCINAVLP